VRAPSSIEQLERSLADQQYVSERSLSVAVYLAVQLGRPLLVEGEAGVGKTEVAKALAGALDTELIRLQCYEGIDVSQALYEWNYPRQLLEIRLLEAAHELDRERATAELFSEKFLIKRPLLRALEPAASASHVNAGDASARQAESVPVLLIDEIDRADDQFEGFLLELLSEFQVTIPELGTIRARKPPIVVITSNRTRELHDALKRRCLYHWIPYPSFEKELQIVLMRMPQAPRRLAEQVTAFVQQLRGADLHRVAGISETLDWVAALVALGQERLDLPVVEQTLGILVKDNEDIESLRGDRLAAIVEASHDPIREPSSPGPSNA
jgi:MoxR-like ATPase